MTKYLNIFLFSYTVILYMKFKSITVNFILSFNLALLLPLQSPGALWFAVIAETVQVMAPKSKQQHVMPFCVHMRVRFPLVIFIDTHNCVCVIREPPPPSLPVMLMLNCPSLKDRGWYSSHNVHSIRPPSSLWSEGWRWSGCRQRRQSCKSYSADWAMSLTALVRTVA